VAEKVAAEELPDVLDRIEFRGIGRQRHEGDVARHQQAPAGLVPAGAVEDENGMGLGIDAAADLGEVEAHQLGADGGQHEGSAGRARRAHGTENVGPVMALIARCRRPGAAARPDPRQRPLLADPGLVLEPDFERLAGGGVRQAFADPGGEVFLNACWAAASFFG